MSISVFSLSEDSLDGRHLVIPIKLSIDNRSFCTHALIDCGAAGYAFIDASFAQRKSLPLTPLAHPRVLNVVDGRPSAGGMLTHLANLGMNVKNHTERGLFFVTQLGHYPVVLGVKWLQIHDPSISWVHNSLTFSSPHCFQECLLKKRSPLIIPGTHDLSEEPPLEAASFLKPTVIEPPEDKVPLEAFEPFEPVQLYMPVQDVK